MSKSKLADKMYASLYDAAYYASFKEEGVPVEWAYYFHLDSARRWRAAGFADPQEAQTWQKATMEYCDAAEAFQWREAGFDPAEAARWLKSGHGVEFATKRKRAGHSPIRSTHPRPMRTR